MQPGEKVRPYDQIKYPIHDVIDQVIQSLTADRNLVLQVCTGAGKTTVVPLAVLNSGIYKGKIYVLQPRRMAAIGAARRMAKLWGDRLGVTVGYRVRHEVVCEKTAKIEVITAGILVRVLRTNRALDGVSIVFFDEFHERSLNSDLSFVLCRTAQIERHADLRLCVMSATLGNLGARIARRLDGCPTIFHEGRMYSVEMENVLFQHGGHRHRMEEKIAELVANSLEQRDGDIMVFLTGKAEIWTVFAYLNNSWGIGNGRVPHGMTANSELSLKPGMCNPNSGIQVLPLYGTLSQDETDDILSPPPPGGRKIILSTPVAESSITVPGIKTVIDCGKRQVKHYLHQSNTSSMKTVIISKASADQRTGRAGRVSCGHCYRMWDQIDHAWRDDSDQAEVVREDLSSCILDLATVGIVTDDQLMSLSWVDPPPSGAVIHAREILRRCRAVDFDGEWMITHRGYDLGLLPIHPRHAHAAMQACGLWGVGVIREACDFVALMEESEILKGGRTDHGCDVLPRYDAVRDFGDTKVFKGTQQRILKASEHMRTLLGVDPQDHADVLPRDARRIGMMVAWAYPEHFCRKVNPLIERAHGGPQVGFRTATGKDVTLEASDRLGECEYLAVAEIKGDRIVWATGADPHFLRLCGMDVKDPCSCRVYDGVFPTRAKKFVQPVQFLQVLKVDPYERRIDPASKRPTTFEKLSTVCGSSYSDDELKHYWHFECTSMTAKDYEDERLREEERRRLEEERSKEREARQRRTDPYDGTPRTFQELKTMCADRYTAEEIEDYWRNSCTPLPDEDDEQHELRMDPADGIARTFLEIQKKYRDRYSLIEIHSYWAQCKVVPPDQVDAARNKAPEPVNHYSMGHGNVSHQLDPLKPTTGERAMSNGMTKHPHQLQHSANKLLQAALGSDIQQWLRTIDEHLVLEHQSIVDEFDSVRQILDLYTHAGNDGARVWNSEQFFEDMRVKKIGHKRLFQKWFQKALCES